MVERRHPKWILRLLGPTLSALLVVLLLHPLAARVGPKSVDTPATSADRGPGAPAEAVIRDRIEKHGDFRRNKKVFVPKVVADQREAQEKYPAIAVLQALDYAVVRRAVANNDYERRVSIQNRGMVVLSDAIHEESTHFLIDVAHAKIAGLGELRMREDGIVLVPFEWRWEPLNELGAAMDLRGNAGKNMRGEAKLTEEEGEWRVVELLMDDTAPRHDVR